MGSLKTISFSVLVVLFMATVAGAIFLLVRSDGSGNPGVEILLPTATPEPELKVYITGAVAGPGGYSLQEGDRLEDALAAAGGATGDAQLDCVNLAQKVTDEAHYHVPGQGEPCQPTSAATTQEDTRIDLNTATPLFMPSSTLSCLH